MIHSSSVQFCHSWVSEICTIVAFYGSVKLSLAIVLSTTNEAAVYTIHFKTFLDYYHHIIIVGTQDTGAV
jgi:hypothetical protein